MGKPAPKAQAVKTKNVPQPPPAMDELQDLKLKLQKAIQSEEFEEAARLRDKIKELEKKNGAR